MTKGKGNVQRKINEWWSPKVLWIEVEQAIFNYTVNTIRKKNWHINSGELNPRLQDNPNR